MQNRTIPLWVKLLIVAAFAAGGLLLIWNQPAPEYLIEKKPLPNEDAEEELIFCTQDAKQCPDGSYVGRQGSNCEFALCPN